MNLRRNVDFQSVPHFSCENENEEFSTLHLGPESRSPLNTFKNQVVMYFMLSYLKPLEKFRSKGQIISCISNLHNCLNYPFCMSGHMTFGQSQNSSGCEGCAAGRGARRLISWGGRGVSCKQGPDQGKAHRVQNVRRPDSQALALHRTNPKRMSP